MIQKGHKMQVHSTQLVFVREQFKSFSMAKHQKAVWFASHLSTFRMWHSNVSLHHRGSTTSAAPPQAQGNLLFEKLFPNCIPWLATSLNYFHPQ